MKKYGRKTLRCSKKLPNGVMERFTVVVMANDCDTAKRNYESMGYIVTVK